MWALGSFPLRTAAAARRSVRGDDLSRLGVLFRGEHLAGRVLIGAAIVVTAVALVVRADSRAPTHPAKSVGEVS